MDKVELKPCPFCGSPARCLRGYETGRVCCSKENCCAYGLQAWPQHWNTRILEAENAALKAKLLRAHRYSCTPTNCMLDGGVEHAQAFEKGGESDEN